MKKEEEEEEEGRACSGLSGSLTNGITIKCGVGIIQRASDVSLGSKWLSHHVGPCTILVSIGVRAPDQRHSGSVQCWNVQLSG